MKAQSSIEFVVIIGAVLLIFITTIGIFQKTLSDKNVEKRSLKFQELAENIRNEINTASKTTNGYQRTFTIPEKVEGMGYEVQVLGDIVYINSTDAKYSSAIEITNVTGQLVKGANTIKKINGIVYLN